MLLFLEVELRMKMVGNEPKIPLSFSFSYFFDGNGSGSRTAGAKMVAG